MNPDDVRETLATHLMSQGIYVTDCKREDGVLHLGYESVADAAGVPKQDVGQVLNLLLDLAGIQGEDRQTRPIDEQGEWTPEDVHVWVFRDDGEGEDRTPVGDWEVHERWVRGYEAGYLSETDLSTLVLSTL